MMKYVIQTKHGHKTVNLNRRKGIKLRCYDCSGFSYAEVDRCGFVDCQLYLFRSGKGRQDAKARSKAIRKFCLWCMNDQQGEVAKCPSQDCSLWPYRKTITEKPSKIESLQEKGHIGPLFERKIERAC